MIPPIHSLLIRDGRTITVRPLQTNDTHHLVELYEHLGMESRATRFEQSKVQVDKGTVWEQAAQITELQRPYGFGLIAFADMPEGAHSVIGAVRYRLSPPDEAEVSITIRDDLQSQGLGTQLMFLIRDYAQAHGIRKLFGLTRASSRFLQRLREQSALALEIIPQGEFTYIVHHIPQPALVIPDHANLMQRT